MMVEAGGTIIVSDHRASLTTQGIQHRIISPMVFQPDIDPVPVQQGLTLSCP